MVTVTAVTLERGGYVTCRGTAGAEGEGSSPRGPDIGLNFHKTRGRQRTRERGENEEEEGRQ